MTPTSGLRKTSLRDAYSTQVARRNATADSDEAVLQAGRGEGGCAAACEARKEGANCIQGWVGEEADGGGERGKTVMRAMCARSEQGGSHSSSRATAHQPRRPAGPAHATCHKRESSTVHTVPTTVCND